MKIFFKHKCLHKVTTYFIFGLVTSFCCPSINFLVSPVAAQPFINSLAVLFRARPPWPTSFPTSGNGNPGAFQVFQNPMPNNPPGPIPAPILANAASQQGILVAHPIPAKLHPNNFRKIPPRPNYGPHPLSNQHRPPPFFQNQNPQIPQNHNQNQNPQNHNQNQNFQSHNHQHQNPQVHNQVVNAGSLVSSSSQVTGSFRYPDVPSPPQFQSMTGRDIPPRFKNWHSSKEFHGHGGGSVGSGQKMDFRPSPQLLEIPSQVFTKSHEIADGKLSSTFQADEAKRLPRYESGFQPISFNQQLDSPTTTAAPTHQNHHHYANHHNYYDPWSVALNPTYESPVNGNPLPVSNPRSVVNAEISKSVVTTDFSIEEVKSHEVSPGGYGNKIASSSERVEDWLTSQARPVKPESSAEKFKFPVYKKKVRPVKCEKFHRYGFCPVSPNYPLAQVEQIATRCSALLSHIIAPLPKTDVHYDIIVTRNGSFRGRTSNKRPGSRGWSWKDYRGKPICDTEEIKVIPGWAKNADGDWLVILQTQLWKQDAQVSICAPPGPHNKCHGESCEKGLSGNFKNTKCVQRFTAQRLAVLDPESLDRCPVVRSVFLPSACVCLSDNPVDDNIFPSADSSAEFHVTHIQGSGSEHVPVLVPAMTSMSTNGTYMIVSEKYSTKESSAISDEFL